MLVVLKRVLNITTVFEKLSFLILHLQHGLWACERCGDNLEMGRVCHFGQFPSPFPGLPVCWVSSFLPLKGVLQATFHFSKAEFNVTKHPFGLSRWHNGKESTCPCRRHGRCRFDSWVRKIPWRRKWQPTLVSYLKYPMDREAWRGTV